MTMQYAMHYADKVACNVLCDPKSTHFHEDIRIFQGCPTIAVSKGGRIFLGWYAGGLREPHMNNFNLLVTSDDGGQTWSKPVLVIPSSYEFQIQALDIQLFIDPAGVLHVQWVQDNTRSWRETDPHVWEGRAPQLVDGYFFGDYRHAEWEMLCEAPDAAELVFTEPRYVYQGFLRCKPTFLNSGRWLNFAYDQLNDRYGYHISDDGGKAYRHLYGGKKLQTDFDESMAYEMRDGRIRMLARSALGELAESYSVDGGETWSEPQPSGIVSADSRFYIGRTPSGRMLLVVNDNPVGRTDMTVCLSEDDGMTWPYKVCIDRRLWLSYPDVDFCGDRICLTYDIDRTVDAEIVFAAFTEEDIIKGREISVTTVSRPRKTPSRDTVKATVEEHKLIAILRGVPADKLLPLADALYAGGVRLLEVTYDPTGEDSATTEAIRVLAEAFAGRLLVGAGTVLTAEQVRLTKLAGGCFIISPDVNESVIRETYRCGMVSMPGAFTPTEVRTAVGYGADFVKLFPVGSVGSGYIRAIRAPLSHIKMLAVGGINADNVADYLAAGACGVGVGANIVDKKLLENGDYAGITALAKHYVEAVQHG